MSLYLESPPELLRALGQRAQQRRLDQRLRQEEVAARAGIGLATLKRFEKTGQTTLLNAVRVAFALGAVEGLTHWFEAPDHASLDEALASARATNRKRVRKHR